MTDVNAQVAEVEPHLYQDYLRGEFTKAAHDFIYKCGLYTPTLAVDNPELFVQKLNTQLDQVAEEASEMLKAFDLDAKEHIDGHVDTMFVTINLFEMVKSAVVIVDPVVASKINMAKLELVSRIIGDLTAYPLPNEATDELMLAAAQRIVENNKLKYTDDKALAESWELPKGARTDGIKLQAIEYEGVTYYSLVDKNGKIRKHKNFIPVQLDDLLNKGESDAG